MKRKVTISARDQQLEIAEYIAADSRRAADRLTDAALNTFMSRPAELIPRIFESDWPETVRLMQVEGFRGYQLYFTVIDSIEYLIAVTAPGLSDASRGRRVSEGFRDVAEGQTIN